MNEGQTPPPAAGSFDLLVEMLGTRNRLVVRRADERISISTELWDQLLHADDDQAGDEGYPLIDAEESTLTVGTPGQRLGQVTYRVVDQVPGWVLLEKVQ